MLCRPKWFIVVVILSQVSCSLWNDLAFADTSECPHHWSNIAKIKSVLPKIASEAGRYLFYPTIAPWRIIYLGSNGGIRNLPVRLFREDGLAIVGSIAFYYEFGLSPAQYVAFEWLASSNTNISYKKHKDRSPNRNNGIFVSANLFDKSDPLYQDNVEKFQSEYSKEKNAHYIHAESIIELRDHLIQLVEKTGLPIAELNINGHGFPGKIIFGSRGDTGDYIDSNRATLLKDDRIQFTPNARIWLESCSAAANFTESNREGESLLKAIGYSLLKNGGTVMGSTRLIMAIDGSSWFHKLLLLNPLLDPIVLPLVVSKVNNLAKEAISGMDPTSYSKYQNNLFRTIKIDPQ